MEPKGTGDRSDPATATGRQSPPQGAREVSGTVAALRLDAVLALGFNLSRSRAALLIKGGLVEVNGSAVDTPARRLKPGDRLLVQGRGGLEIASLAGESRKGRQKIKLYKFV